jgi:hypothetical protein
MVDSGHDAGAGKTVYRVAYSAMVDASLARPPEAEVQAFWLRQGNLVKFSVQVKNLSNTMLSSSNQATVHVLIYEEAHLQLTNRFVIATVNTPISSLASGATATYQLQTGDLVGADWTKLHYIALVDYIPNSSTGIYDLLQAAQVLPLPEVQPEQLVFLVDNSAAIDPIQFAKVQAASNLTWNATVPPGNTWLSVTPTGSLSTPVQVTVNKAALANGWQQAVILFSSPDSPFYGQVTVSAYLGDLISLFLPMTAK